MAITGANCSGRLRSSLRMPNRSRSRLSASWCAWMVTMRNAAPLFDVLAAQVGVIARHKDYQVLDLPAMQAILAGPPAATCTHPESQMTRVLFDCPDVPLSPAGPRVRLLVATSPATADSPSVGERRAEMVYELFVSTLLPRSAPKMCSICTCIAVPLRPFSRMKMRSKMPIVGFRTRLADRNVFRSWPSGYGI